MQRLPFRYRSLALLAVLGFATLAWLPPQAPPEDAPTPLSLVRNRLKERNEEFKQRLLTFKAFLEKADTATPAEGFRRQFVACREAYKRIEYAVEHLTPTLADDINGPAMTRIEVEEVTLFNRFPPRGLQVIEEMVYDDQPGGNVQPIARQLDIVLDRQRRFTTHLQKLPITDGLLLEAVRFEVGRIQTLGIAGFDSPVAKRSISEAAVAMEELAEVVAFYYPLLPAARKALRDSVEHLFAENLRFLRNGSDFDRFDRFTYHRDYANPLYDKLGDFHLALEVGSRLDYPWLPSTNYNANSIWDEDFINPLFYAPWWGAKENSQRVALGKTLFHDPILSHNLERTCASCHLPEKAFTDGLAKSRAYNPDTTIQRNAPTLLNSALARLFRHDAKVQFLEMQMPLVFFHPDEFNADRAEIVYRLRQSPEYIELFREATESDTTVPVDKLITLPMVNQMLAAYVRSLVRLNSPFDQMVRGERPPEPAVVRGFNVFMGKGQCGTCHFPPSFNGTVPPLYTETESEVLGTLTHWDPWNPTLDPDLGRYEAVRAEEFRHAFKTPTVRNVALTAPYMHNGGFKDLNEVIAFYNRGGAQGLGLDLPNQTLPPDSLNLSAQEQEDLVTFMNALTDTSRTLKPVRKLPSYSGKYAKWNDRKISGSY